MPGCGNCGGGSYGQLILGGNGIAVSGTGTKADPVVIDLNVAELDLGQALKVVSSSTVEFGRRTAGSTVTLGADVVMRSPSGARWTLAVADDGSLSTTPAGPPRTGGTLDDGTVSGVALFWDPVSQTWESRTNAAKVIWSSVGSTGVPIPPGFKKGDVWIKAAS